MDMMTRTMSGPCTGPDWCAFAEVVLGEASFDPPVT